jgi:hypothetical protein
MKNITIYRILITISMMYLILSVLLSLPQIFTDGTLSSQSSNIFFGYTIIINLFLTHNIIKIKTLN